MSAADSALAAPRLSARPSVRRRIALVRHELRTPLNAILGYSEMLAEDAQDMEDAEAESMFIEINAIGKDMLASIDQLTSDALLGAPVIGCDIRKQVFKQILEGREKVTGLLKSLRSGHVLSEEGNEDIQAIETACEKLLVLTRN